MRDKITRLPTLEDIKPLQNSVEKNKTIPLKKKTQNVIITMRGTNNESW